MINLHLSTTIRNLRNKQFMHLYLQLMQLTEKYEATTKNEYLQRVYEIMQKEVEGVKQLDLELNAPSDAVEKRNEVHEEIKDSIRFIKGNVKAYKLWYIQSYRDHATYISDKIGELILLQSVSSISATVNTIAKIRTAIEADIKLANALLELDLMDRMAILFKQGEEFEQLDVQKNIESVTAPVIDKRAIRKEATSTLKTLFNVIEMFYSQTKDNVWKEMAAEMKRVVESWTRTQIDS